jgi:hypothetical protein
MASVYLNFVPPNDVPDLIKLHIYEATAQAGPFSEIEAVTEIGSPGRYITDYTTDQATATTDWFAIQWENSKGVFSTMSSAIQGGTTSVVSEIVDRVMLRDPTLKEQIVAQEAAGVVEGYYRTLTPDPSTVTMNQMSGLTLLTMARCYLLRVATGAGTSQSWSAGLITERFATTTATQTLKSIEDLIRVANSWLGRTYTVVALMQEVDVASNGGSTSRLTGVDISRSLYDFDTGPVPQPFSTTALFEGEGMGDFLTLEEADARYLQPVTADQNYSRASHAHKIVEFAKFNLTTSIDIGNDPGAGKLGFDSTNPAAIQYISLSARNQDGVDISPWYQMLVANDQIKVQDQANSALFGAFFLKSPPSPVTTYWLIPVALDSFNLPLTNNRNLEVYFMHLGHP